jgi:prevent-host-death family protein
MPTVNLHEAKTHLSRLVDAAARGETFIIAKAGKPLVRVSAIAAPRVPQRVGLLEGEISVPADFDRMGQREIEALFGVGE